MSLFINYLNSSMFISVSDTRLARADYSDSRSPKVDVVSDTHRKLYSGNDEYVLGVFGSNSLLSVIQSWTTGTSLGNLRSTYLRQFEKDFAGFKSMAPMAASYFFGGYNSSNGQYEYAALNVAESHYSHDVFHARCQPCWIVVPIYRHRPEGEALRKDTLAKISEDLVMSSTQEFQTQQISGEQLAERIIRHFTDALGQIASSAEHSSYINGTPDWAVVGRDTGNRVQFKPGSP